jgi:ribulose 1,5-bisphosphate synthetase/thiazole synthase
LTVSFLHTKSASLQPFKMRSLILTSLAAMAAAVTTLDRDIVILGGGSSGTYAAVQLVDQNQFGGGGREAGQAGWSNPYLL